VEKLTNRELADLVQAGNVYRGKAVFELADRAKAEDADAIKKLGELTRLPQLRNDKLFHRVSLAWAAITALLAAEHSSARSAAYAAFAELPEAEQQDFLLYLSCDRIEDAHPRL
jgi:hypothetical protein